MDIKNTDHTEKHLPIWLDNFLHVYQSLGVDNLSLLTKVYHNNITFIDPMHRIEGLDKLNNYFQGLYQNLSHCHFDIENYIYQDDQAAIYWSMSYQHKSLNQGKVVTVQGSSHIKGVGDKVIFHRDYLDLGAMLYEQLPVVGKLTQWIKRKAVSNVC